MVPSSWFSISIAVREVPAKKLEPSWLVSKIWSSVLEESANKSSPEFISVNKVLVFDDPVNVVREFDVF